MDLSKDRPTPHMNVARDKIKSSIMTVSKKSHGRGMMEDQSERTKLFRTVLISGTVFCLSFGFVYGLLSLCLL